MKILGIALVVLGLATLIPAGIMTSKDMRRSRTFDEKIRDLSSQRSEARDELRGISLEFRGYQKSIPTMPDSTKKQKSGEIMAASREYNKKIRLLESKEKELTRLILRQQSVKGERNARMRWWMAGLGGGGVLLVALGLGVARRG